MQDQSKQIDDILSNNPAGAQTIAITSGKGGVGKSNIAINLAIGPGTIG